GAPPFVRDLPGASVERRLARSGIPVVPKVDSPAAPWGRASLHRPDPLHHPDVTPEKKPPIVTHGRVGRCPGRLGPRCAPRQTRGACMAEQVDRGEQPSRSRSIGRRTLLRAGGVLGAAGALAAAGTPAYGTGRPDHWLHPGRSEERRVGKAWRTRRE